MVTVLDVTPGADAPPPPPPPPPPLLLPPHAAVASKTNTPPAANRTWVFLICLLRPSLVSATLPPSIRCDDEPEPAEHSLNAVGDGEHRDREHDAEDHQGHVVGALRAVDRQGISDVLRPQRQQHDEDRPVDRTGQAAQSAEDHCGQQ